MFGVQRVDDALSGQVDAECPDGLASGISQRHCIGGDECAACFFINVGIAPARQIIINRIVVKLSLRIVMLVTGNLCGNYAISKSSGNWFQKVFTVGVIAGNKSHKTAYHVIVRCKNAAMNAVNPIGMINLLLNRPQIVVYHFLVGLKHAFNAQRLLRKLTLGAIIQLILNQAMGIFILKQGDGLNEHNSKQDNSKC